MNFDPLSALIGVGVGMMVGAALVDRFGKTREVEPTPRQMFDRIIRMRAERALDRMASIETNKIINDAVEKITGERPNDF